MAETNELRVQLQSINSPSGTNGTGNIWSALDSGVTDLQRELGSLASQLETALSVSTRAGNHSNETASEPISRSSSAGTGVGASNVGTLSPATSLLASAELESRVSAMEVVLGLTGGTSPEPAAQDSSPLGSRLAGLERQLALLSSPAELDALSLRAERAAASLRALSDAKAAAQAGLPDPAAMVIASGRLARAAEAAESLSALAAQVLPPLSSRLLSLDTLHREAALFTQRLAGVEDASARSEAMLREDAGLLREVQAALQALEGRLQLQR